MNRCIFRYKNGFCCKYKTLDINCQYCSLHKKNKNDIFNITNNIIKDPDININAFEIMNIYIYLYKTFNDITFRKDLLIFLLGNKNRLINIAFNLGLFFSNRTLKKNIFDKIIDKLEWHCMILNLKYTKRKIKLLENTWLSFIHKLNGSHLKPSSNSEDIFTFEPLDSIKHVFYIKDNNITYGFDINNLYYFIIKSGSWNPYTKNIIESNDILRLQKYIKIKNIVINNSFSWITPQQAYTDIVLQYQNIGFYIDVNWFLEFKPDDIIKIINKYHQLSFLLPSLYMDNEYLNKIYPDYIYQFCNMIMDIFNNTDDPDLYSYLCFLYKSFTYVSKKFKDNAPSWIQDIETSFLIEININILE